MCRRKFIQEKNSSLSIDFTESQKNLKPCYELFDIFEKNFNDFWSEKINEISSDTGNEISMANLLQNKEDIISELNIEIGNLKQDIVRKEKLIKETTVSKDYESAIKEENKKLKKELKQSQKENTDLQNQYETVDRKFNEFKSQLDKLRLG